MGFIQFVKNVETLKIRKINFRRRFTWRNNIIVKNVIEPWAPNSSTVLII